MIPPSQMVPPPTRPRPNPPPKIAARATVEPEIGAPEIAARATGVLATVELAIVALVTGGPEIGVPGIAAPETAGLATARRSYCAADWARLRQSGLVLP